MASITTDEAIGQAILQVLKDRIDTEAAGEIAAIRERIEAKVREACAGLALQLLNEYSIERDGKFLMIRVKIGP